MERKSTLSDQCGASFLEYVLILPVVLGLFFVTLDLGWRSYQISVVKSHLQRTLSNAISNSNLSNDFWKKSEYSTEYSQMIASRQALLDDLKRQLLASGLGGIELQPLTLFDVTKDGIKATEASSALLYPGATAYSPHTESFLNNKEVCIPLEQQPNWATLNIPPKSGSSCANSAKNISTADASLRDLAPLHHTQLCIVASIKPLLLPRKTQEICVADYLSSTDGISYSPPPHPTPTVPPLTMCDRAETDEWMCSEGMKLGPQTFVQPSNNPLKITVTGGQGDAACRNILDFCGTLVEQATTGQPAKVTKTISDVCSFRIKAQGCHEWTHLFSHRGKVTKTSELCWDVRWEDAHDYDHNDSQWTICGDRPFDLTNASNLMTMDGGQITITGGHSDAGCPNSTDFCGDKVSPCQSKTKVVDGSCPITVSAQGCHGPMDVFSSSRVEMKADGCWHVQWEDSVVGGDGDYNDSYWLICKDGGKKIERKTIESLECRCNKKVELTTLGEKSTLVTSYPRRVTLSAHDGDASCIPEFRTCDGTVIGAPYFGAYSLDVKGYCPIEVRSLGCFDEWKSILDVGQVTRVDNCWYIGIEDMWYSPSSDWDYNDGYLAICVSDTSGGVPLGYDPSGNRFVSPGFFNFGPMCS